MVTGFIGEGFPVVFDSPLLASIAMFPTERAVSRYEEEEEEGE